jgi:hypothetical protein
MPLLLQNPENDLPWNIFEIKFKLLATWQKGRISMPQQVVMPISKSPSDCLRGGGRHANHPTLEFNQPRRFETADRDALDTGLQSSSFDSQIGYRIDNDETTYFLS